MNALSVTAVTNFILAGEVLFFAGMLAQVPKTRFSAAWHWSWAMTLFGLAALIGGIDHGFVEASGLPRYFIQRLNWILLGAMTFFLLLTTAVQFFSSRIQRLLLIVGIVQFAVNTVVVLLIDSYFVVIVNYGPVMLLLLVMNIAGLKNGTGSRDVIAGIGVLIAASAIQATDMDVFNPLDHNGLYHVVTMTAVPFLYRGGLRFRNTLNADS